MAHKQQIRWHLNRLVKNAGEESESARFVAMPEHRLGLVSLNAPHHDYVLEVVQAALESSVTLVAFDPIFGRDRRLRVFERLCDGHPCQRNARGEVEPHFDNEGGWCPKSKYIPRVPPGKAMKQALESMSKPLSGQSVRAMSAGLPGHGKRS